MSNGFRPIVPRECSGDRAAHEANLFDIDQKYGDVMSLEEVLDELDRLAPEQANIVQKRSRNAGLLGYRANWGVIVPSTNTSVQPEFEDMKPRGVTNHTVRIWIPDELVNSMRNSMS